LECWRNRKAMRRGFVRAWVPCASPLLTRLALRVRLPLSSTTPIIQQSNTPTLCHSMSPRKKRGWLTPTSLDFPVPPGTAARAGGTPALRCERVNNPSRRPCRHRDRPASRTSCPFPESR
jgi:hypothetical protein